MSKEYAGKELAEIRAYYADEGYTETFRDSGAKGFDLWRPDGNSYEELAAHNCAHVVVWPREDGGYWAEEY